MCPRLVFVNDILPSVTKVAQGSYHFLHFVMVASMHHANSEIRLMLIALINLAAPVRVHIPAEAKAFRNVMLPQIADGSTQPNIVLRMIAIEEKSGMAVEPSLWRFFHAQQSANTVLEYAFFK